MAQRTPTRQDNDILLRLVEDPRFQELPEDIKPEALRLFAEEIGLDFPAPESRLFESGEEVIERQLTPPRPTRDIPSMDASPQEKSRRINESILNVGVPLATGVVSASAASGTGPGAIAAGNLGFEAADALMRKATGREQRPPSLLPETDSTAVNLGFKTAEGMAAEGLLSLPIQGVVRGRQILGELDPNKTVFGGNANFITAIRNRGLRALGITPDPGSTVGTLSAILGETVGQSNTDATIADLLEGTLTAAEKQAQMRVSASTAMTEAERLASQRLGRGVSFDDYQRDIGDRVVNNLVTDYYTTIAAGAEKFEGVRMISTANRQTIKPPAGLKIDGRDLPPELNIDGPIQMTDTYNALASLRTDIINRTGTVTGANQPLAGDVGALLNQINKEIDEVLLASGIPEEHVTQALRDKFMQNVPIGYERILSDKKALGNLAFESNPDTPKYIIEGYRRIFRAMSTDIERGIGTWKNNSDDALRLFKEGNEIYESALTINSPGRGRANALVDSRDVFGADQLNRVLDRQGVVRTLRNIDRPQEFIENILKDEELLQRVLSAGEIRIPGQPGKISANRRELQAYKFMSLLDGNTRNLPDGTIVRDNLLENWRAYANSDAGKKLFGARRRSLINEFIEGVAKIGSGGPSDTGASRYLTLRLLAGGTQVVIGGGLMVFAASESAGLGAGASTSLGLIGAVLTARQLGKLMVNPDTARLIVAAQKGGSLGVSNQRAAFLVSAALRGEALELLNEDGTTTPGRVNRDNQIVRDSN